MYGYSIWLVPYYYKDLQKQYKMDHIPHVTIATNMMHIPNQILSTDVYFITKFSDLSTIDSNACGYYCEIPNLTLNHTPHLTLWYAEEPRYYFNKPVKEIACELRVADTRSSNPKDWKLL